MNLRKFVIMSVEMDMSGPGPDRAFKIHYRAIKNKVWVENKLWIIAKTAKEAREKALQRFGGRN